jgi:hypothetical protein
MAMHEDDRVRVSRQGTEAWRRLKREKNWNDWLKVGEALLVGRDWAMSQATTNQPQGKAYNMAFGEWLQRYKLDDMDKGDRSRLFQVMGNLPMIEQWRQTLTLTERLKLNHPNAVWRKFKAAHEPPDKDKEGRPTLRDSVANLSEANDAKDREIAQLKDHIAELEAAREPTPANKEKTPALRKEYVTRATILTIPERRKELIALAHGMGFDIDIKAEPEAVYLTIPGFKNKRGAEPAAAPPGRTQDPTRTVGLEELVLKLGPILKALETEAVKKTAGLIAPAIIRGIANDLQMCLNEWILPMEKRQQREHPRVPGAVTTLTTKQKKALRELLGA